MSKWLPCVFLTYLLFPAHAQGGQDRYHCSYYLFEESNSAKGCSECYIPLLVMKQPIEAKHDQDIAVIITYERDSIWELKRGKLEVMQLYLDAAAKRIRFAGGKYRYQLVSNDEALRLLQHPFGSIPIARLKSPVSNDDDLAKQLLRDLSVFDARESCTVGAP
ncbi:MAG: hypothetical protein U1F34_01300 [Gammaproteobacteria bacterium]